MTNLHKTTRKEKATTTNSGIMDISGSKNAIYNVHLGPGSNIHFF